MQLHPADSQRSIKHCLDSLAAGFMGLDFEKDPGDLRVADKKSVKQSEKDYFDFALKMQPEDKVLIISHHYPFALVTVESDYNYIKTPVGEIGVWFRHFRRIKSPQFYFDRVTNPNSWQQLTMTDTISSLKDCAGDSYRLIESWK